MAQKTKSAPSPNKPGSKSSDVKYPAPGDRNDSRVDEKK